MDKKFSREQAEKIVKRVKNMVTWTTSRTFYMDKNDDERLIDYICTLTDIDIDQLPGTKKKVGKVQLIFDDKQDQTQRTLKKFLGE